MNVKRSGGTGKGIIEVYFGNACILSLDETIELYSS
jgi:hypothetical protein